MSLKFRPGRYFIGVWFASDGRTKDWMGSVYRDGDGPWVVRHRFRHYKSEKVWDSGDHKDWYEASGTITEDAAKEAMDQLLAAMPLGGFTKTDFCPMFSDDPEENIRRLSECPWVHMKVMSKDEAIRDGYI